MLDIRIAEAQQHVARELLQFVLRQGQRGDNFLRQGVGQPGAHLRVVDGVAHGFQAGQQGHGHQRRMAAVEDAHLALLVGRHFTLGFKSSIPGLGHACLEHRRTSKSTLRCSHCAHVKEASKPLLTTLACVERRCTTGAINYWGQRLSHR